MTRLILLKTSSLSEANLTPLAARFTDSEKRRLKSMTDQKTKLQFVLSHFLLHEVLQQELQGPSVNLRFPDHGKPYLTTGNAYFNLSHSNDHIALVINSDDPVAVDIECKLTKNFDKLANRYFHQKEIEFIQSKTSLQNKQKAFQLLWTLKESAYKNCQTKMESADYKFFFNLIEKNVIHLPQMNTAQFGYHQNDDFSLTVCSLGTKTERIEVQTAKLHKESLQFQSHRMDFEFLSYSSNNCK